MVLLVQPLLPKDHNQWCIIFGFNNPTLMLNLNRTCVQIPECQINDVKIDGAHALKLISYSGKKY